MLLITGCLLEPIKERANPYDEQGIHGSELIVAEVLVGGRSYTEFADSEINGLSEGLPLEVQEGEEVIIKFNKAVNLTSLDASIDVNGALDNNVG